jgi:hypothetical protein
VNSFHFVSLDPHDRGAAKAQRRRFTAACQKKIPAEVDACKERGEVGALLRREGLYLAGYRRGVVLATYDPACLEPKKRGPKAKVVDERDKEIADLRHRIPHGLEKHADGVSAH